MIQAESVHCTSPLNTSAITPKSPQDWLDVGDASPREVFEAAQAGHIGRPGAGLRQCVATKILLSLTVALLFGSRSADGLAPGTGPRCGSCGIVQGRSRRRTQPPAAAFF
jgi:hypothetical protein